MIELEYDINKIVKNKNNIIKLIEYFIKEEKIDSNNYKQCHKLLF